jgi:glycerol 3-phosphatase-2
MSQGSDGSQDSRDPGDVPAGHSGPQGDPQAWYQRGLELLDRGSPAAAAQILQRAAAAEPRSRSVREALARAQFGARRYAEAADSFRMIVEASPADDYAHFGLGLALARSGDPASAAEYLALAAAMRPDSKHYTDALHAVRATLQARRSQDGAAADSTEDTGSVLPMAGLFRIHVPSKRHQEAERVRHDASSCCDPARGQRSGEPGGTPASPWQGDPNAGLSAQPVSAGLTPPRVRPAGVMPTGRYRGGYERTWIQRMSVPAAAPAAPRSCDEPLCRAYDVALLDLDGVVYLGSGHAVIPGAPQALRKAAAEGMRLAYVTNNAYRTPAAIAGILDGFGIPAEASEVVTSAQAAARLLAEKLPPGSPVLVVGGMGLRLAVRARGLRPVSTAAERPLAVAQGYSPDVSYPLLAEGSLAVAAGALFVGSNGDTTLPDPRGRTPGNGALLQVITTATGRQPLIAGKPEPPLHAESVARTGAKRPLIVGDRLSTDIEAAWRVGADSLLVLTGVTSPADAVLAPPHQRPAYLAEDVAGLLEPQPAVRAERGEYGCGGWTARWDEAGRRLDLAGEGKRADGLRALCAAAWPRGDVTAETAEPALRALEERAA